MEEHRDARIALPPPGTTAPGERVRLREADASGTTVGLDEAAQRFGISVSTLRRRLGEGAVAGAHKVAGPKGQEWRIPIAGLESLGYHEISPGREPPTAVPASVAPEVAQLLASLHDLTDALSLERRAIHAGYDERARLAEEREAARVEAARLEAALDAERRRAGTLETERDRAVDELREMWTLSARANLVARLALAPRRWRDRWERAVARVAASSPGPARRPRPGGPAST